MNIYAISGLINAILVSILGIFVYSKNKNNILNRKYSIFCFFVAAWCFCYFQWQIADTKAVAFFWSRGLMAGAIFIPISFLNFVLSLLGLYEEKKGYISYGYPIFVFFFLSNFTNLFIKDLAQRMFFPFWPVPGILFTPFLMLWLFYCIYPCYLLFVHHKHFSGEKQNQIKYVLLGILVGYSTGSTNYFLWYNIPIPPYGNLIVPLFVGLMAYAIVKFRLMEIRIAVTRAGLSLFVYAIVLGVPFWLGYRILGSISFWYIPLILGIVFAFIGPLFYGFLRGKAENILLAEQKAYQKVLAEASQGMVQIDNLNKLLKLIVILIKKYVKVNYAVAYLNDPENKQYLLKAERGDVDDDIPEEFSYDHPFIGYIKKEALPFTYGEIPEEIRKSFTQVNSEAPARRSRGVGLVVPSMINESLLGFLVMGHKENNRLFTIDDINIFKIISNNAAMSVHTILVAEKAKKDQETLMNIARETLIGAMATGTAHQFLNRLNVIGLAVQNIFFNFEDMQVLIDEAKKKGVDFEKNIAEVLDTLRKVKEEVLRSVTIVQGILNLSKMEKEGIEKTEFKLSELIGAFMSTLMLKQNLNSVDEVPLKAELGDDDTIYGSKQQMFYTIYNAIDNGYESVIEEKELSSKGSEKKDYTPEIKVKLIQKEKTSLLVISDNGIGIKEEDKGKIFAPFYTSKVSSKHSHSGVGMYFAKRNVEDYHNGRLWFESEEGKGASFFIEIPRKLKNA